MAIGRAPDNARLASRDRKQRGGWIGFRKNCSRAGETMTEKSEDMGKIIFRQKYMKQSIIYDKLHQFKI
jgi:hypothetical protein